MGVIRGWAYERTLDDACKDVEEIGELAMEFDAVGAVFEEASDPIIHVIRNSHIRHFIGEGGVSDCVEGLAKVQGDDMMSI